MTDEARVGATSPRCAATGPGELLLLFALSVIAGAVVLAGARKLSSALASTALYDCDSPGA